MLVIPIIVARNVSNRGANPCPRHPTLARQTTSRKRYVIRWPLILPNLFGDAFSIFLLRQFLVTIPQSYIDAARIDGASEFGVLWRVVIPMARPGIAAAALFSFLNPWNDYFGPLLYAGENPDEWTLSLAPASFQSQHQVLGCEGLTHIPRDFRLWARIRATRRFSPTDGSLAVLGRRI